jgi:hypothetical protein
MLGYFIYFKFGSCTACVLKNRGLFCPQPQSALGPRLGLSVPQNCHSWIIFEKLSRRINPHCISPVFYGNLVKAWKIGLDCLSYGF